MVSSGLQAAEFELVGNTVATFNGAGGLLNFNSDCAVDFPGSRMCTSEEVMGTIDPPTVSRSSWVRPTFVPTSDGVNSDISGIQASTPGNLSCKGWIVPGVLIHGLFVSPVPGPTGSIRFGPCDAFRAVACCAPVPVSESRSSVAGK